MVGDGLTPLIAFGAGIVSFFAPCIIPIVPAFLTFVTGGPTATPLHRAIRTVSFVLGFSIAFVVLGVLIGLLGSSGVFEAFSSWAFRVGGALIILFGLHMTGLLRLSVLDRDVRYHGTAPMKAGPVVGALALGAAFGVGWSPCVGPVLATILILAGAQASASAGGLLLGSYALGLALPFLAVGLMADRGSTVLRRFGKAARRIEIGGGILLILIGIFVFTGATARLTSYLFPGGA